MRLASPLQQINLGAVVRRMESDLVPRRVSADARQPLRADRADFFILPGSGLDAVTLCRPRTRRAGANAAAHGARRRGGVRRSTRRSCFRPPVTGFALERVGDPWRGRTRATGDCGENSAPIAQPEPTTMPQQTLFTHARVFDGQSADSCRRHERTLVADGLIQRVTSASRSRRAAGASSTSAGADAGPDRRDARAGERRLDVARRGPRRDIAIPEHAKFARPRARLRLHDGARHRRRQPRAAPRARRTAWCGPRYLSTSGKILSMTGGHGDLRLQERAAALRVETAPAPARCSPTAFAGARRRRPRVHQATREELRQGAHRIRSWARAASPRRPTRSG